MDRQCAWRRGRPSPGRGLVEHVEILKARQAESQARLAGPSQTREQPVVGVYPDPIRLPATGPKACGACAFEVSAPDEYQPIRIGPDIEQAHPTFGS